MLCTVYKNTQTIISRVTTYFNKRVNDFSTKNKFISQIFFFFIGKTRSKNYHCRFYFIGKTRSKKVFKSSFLAFLFDPTEYLKNDQMVLKIYLLTTIGTGRARIKTPSSAQNPPMSWKYFSFKRHIWFVNWKKNINISDENFSERLQ